MEPFSAHLVLTAVAFLAATVLPGSSEALLATLVVQQPEHLPTLLAAATAGNTGGAVLNWALGRWLIKAAGLRWFPASPAAIERASGWFGRYGTWLLLFSWVPIVGDPLTVAAGLLRVRFMPFLLTVALGKAARYIAIAGGIEAFRSWFE
jgi:membrane protein YqaA with SNARE-associated domain